MVVFNYLGGLETILPLHQRRPPIHYCLILLRHVKLLQARPEPLGKYNGSLVMATERFFKLSTT